MKRTDRCDAGEIVLGWLTKVTVVLATLGVLSYDGIALVTTHVSVDDHAQTIASKAADDVVSTRSIDVAYRSAATEAEASGDTLAPADFVVDPDGTVHVTLEREATSVWMVHISPLKRFLTVRATRTGKPAS